MDHLLLKLIDDSPIVYVLVTSLISALLSFFVGLERQLHGEAAGVRTHTVLAAGSSLLMTLSVWAIRMAANGDDFGPINYDAARIAAAVVAGIGFLGGGVIGASGPAVLGWMNAHFTMSAGIASLSAFALAGAASICVARLFFFERDRKSI